MKKILLIIILNLFLLGAGLAQWVKTNGLYGGTVRFLAVDKITNSVYSGFDWGNIYRSTNFGSTWTHFGKVPITSQGSTIDAIYANGDNVFAKCENQIFLSTDNGASWSTVSIGSLAPGAIINVLVFDGTKIYAGTNGGIFLSTDIGSNWIEFATDFTVNDITSIAINGDDIFAGSNGGGVFMSANNGTSWSEVNSGLSETGLNIKSLVLTESTIMAINNDGVAVSDYGSGIWQNANAGLPSMNFAALTVSGVDFFIGLGDNGVYTYDRTSNFWIARNLALTGKNVSTLASSANKIYVGFYGRGVFISSNNGIFWFPVNQGLEKTIITSLEISDNIIFAGDNSANVFLSYNSGINWSAKNEGLDDYDLYALAKSDNYLFAGLLGGGVFRSNNNGDLWAPANTGLNPPSMWVLSLAATGNKVFAGTNSGGVYFSDNEGSSWTAVNSGLTNLRVYSISISGSKIFAGTDGGVFLSENNGTNWTAINNGLSSPRVSSIAISDNNIFAATWDGGVFLSTNNGSSWTEVNNGLTNLVVRNIATTGTKIFAGTQGDGIFLSTDNGSSWNPVSTGLEGQDIIIYSIGISQTDVFVGIGDLVEGVNGVWKRPLSDFKDLSVSSNTLTVAAPVNSTRTFDITTNTDWTVSSNQSWLVPSSLSGSGNATITLTAQANSLTTTRTATITVSGTDVTSQNITVTQEGAPAGCGTITDVDGNVYNTVTIGTQCWMQENLKTTKLNDGTSVQLVTDNIAWKNMTTPEYCWYNNDEISNKTTYGALYNWYTVNTGRLCPSGWHVPSISEWNVLVDYLTNNGYGFEGSGNDIAKSMAAKSGWISSEIAGTIGNDQISNNSSGFSALPGAGRNDAGAFDGLGYGYWWSADENGISSDGVHILGYELSTIFFFNYGKTVGVSVRCVQGGAILLPSVNTVTPSNVSNNSATVGGNIISDGGASITARGVCWSTLTNPTISDNKTTDGNGTGAFASSLAGLTPGTTYYVKAYATNSFGTAYGNELSFTTLSETMTATLTGSGDGCTGSTSTIKSVITGGTAPYSLNYTINGVAQPGVSGYISGSNIDPGVLPVGANIFEITSIEDANSNSIDAGDLPPAYTINIYNIPDAGTTVNNSPFICNNESTDIVLHSDIPNTDFNYTVTYSPATTWQSGKSPAPGTIFNGEGLSIIQNLAHNSTEPVVVTYTIIPVGPVPTVCPGPAINIVVVVNPIGQVNQPVNQTVCDGSFVPAVPFTTVNTPGISTFLWTNNNTTIGLAGWGFNSTEIPSFTAINTGNTSVTASIVVTPIFINGGSCIGPTKTFTIMVRPTPKLSSTLTPPAICSGTNFSYNPTSATAGTTFNWSRSPVAGISNASASGTGNPNEILINTTSSPVSVRYVYTLTANSCSNPATYNVDVVVNPKPVLVITNPNFVCFPSTVDLTASAVTSGSTSGLTLSYWTNAGATSAYATPAAAAAGTYYLKSVIPATGCYDIKPVTVTVNPVPVLTSTLTPGSICSSFAFSYNPTSSTSGTIFNWTRAAVTGISNSASAGTGNPNETLDNTTAAPVTVHYIYTLSANGCTNPSTYNVAVVVNPTPILTSTLTPAAVCSNFLFSYNPTSNTAGTIFNWSRAAVAGILNSSATGVGNINETLINTTIDPVLVTYVYALSANGCNYTQAVNVLVFPRPSLISTLTPPAVCSSTLFMYTPVSATAGTTFSWSRPPVSGISNAATTGSGSVNETLINTTTSPKVVTYIYTLMANGCSNIQNVTVTVNPVPDVSTVSPTTVCSGEVTNIVLNSNIAGTTYTWTVGAITGGVTGATSSNGSAINQALVNPGFSPQTVTYIVTPTANLCTGIPYNIVVTVKPTPNVSTASLTTICTGTSTNIVLNSNVAGTTFTWTIGPITGGITGATASSGPAINQTLINSGTTPGTVTYRVLPLANSCPGIPTDIIVNVNPTTETPAFTAGATTVCQNGPDVTYTAMAANATSITYTVSPLAAGTINAATGVMNWDAAFSGPATITATATGLCGILSSIRIVDVQPTPNLIINSPSGVCTPGTVDLTAPAVTSGSTSGLTFSYWTDASASSVYATPAAATAGTYYIKGATVTGCFDIKPVTVTVNPVPVITSTLTPPSICSNTTFSYTPSSSTIGTIFNWIRAAVTGISNSAGSGTGNPNETLINTTVAPVTVLYAYSLSASGCTNSAAYDVAVVVYPTPILISTLTPAAICSNSLFSYTPASGTSGTTFAWSRAAVAGISNSASTGVDNPNETLINITANPIVVTYVYTLTANGCSNTQNVTVTVNPTPTLSTPLTNGAICNNTPFIYMPASSTAGTTYAWSRPMVSGISNAAATGSISVNETLINTTTSTKVVTYIYTLTANGCINVQNVIVTVNPTPVINPIVSTICSENLTSIVLNSNVTGTTYSWTIGPITGGIVGATPSTGPVINQMLVNPGTTQGTVTYIVTPMANFCPGIPYNIVVYVNPKPVLTNPFPVPICSESFTNIVLNSNIPGTMFNWTVGSVTGGIGGATASAGPVINQFLINTGSTPGTVTYIVTPTVNFCQGNPVNIVLTANPKPVATTSGITAICSETSTNIPLNSTIPGTTFTWTLGPITGAITGATPAGGSSINQVLHNPGNTPGTVTYIVTPTANLCQGNLKNIVVNVNPVPNVSTVSPTTICSGTSTNIILTGSVTGTTFNWNVMSITGGITGASNSTGPSINQVLTNPLMTPGTVTYLVTPISNSCVGIPLSITVTVNPLTGAPLFTAGATAVCQDAPDETYTATAINSISVIYSVLPVSAGVIDPLTGLMNWHAAFSGTATISATATGICGITTAYRIVAVNALTGIPVFTAGSIAICQDAPDEVYSASASNSTSLIYSILPAAAGVIDPLTGLMNWDAAFSGAATVTVTASGLCGTTSKDMQVMVNPAPLVVINDPSAVCSPAIVDLTLPAVTAGSTSGLTYSYWTDAGATSTFTTPASAVTGVYFIKGTTLSGCFDIRPVTVTVSQQPVAIAGGSQTICTDGTATVTGAVSIYGTPLWTTDGAGILSNETSLAPTYSPTAEDAGKTVILTMTVTSDNTCGPQTATAAYSIVVKLAQAITFNPPEDKVYGDTPFTLTANASSSLGVVYSSNDNSVITISGSTVMVAGAGSAAIYANQSGNATYCAAPAVSQIVKVLPKIVTVTANPLQSKAFGDADPVFTYSFSPALVGTDVITGALSRIPGEEIGVDYAITQGTLDAGPNYHIAFIPDNFNITIGTITISVNANQSKVYGDPDPVFTYSVTPSSVSAASLTGSPGRVSGENVGTTYPISQGTLSSDKYTINFIPADFSITPKPITVTAVASQSKIYGEADPLLAYSVTPSLIGADELSGMLSRDAGEDVGNLYLISQGSIDAGANYLISFAPTNFSITPKPITVTADPSQSKQYGDPDPELKYSFSPEMIGLDGFTGFLSRTVGENAGSGYRITRGSLSAGPNYTLTFVSNNFTIATKQITLTVLRGQNKVYGSTDPVFLYNYTPALPGNDNISGLLARTSGENAGNYAIQLGTITLGHNYTIIFVPASFTINKAPLSVTVDATERRYLEANPGLTLSFSGFVNGENKNVLDVLPTTLVSANASSDAGKYTIQLSGGSDNNYFYEFTDGILTILKADQYITFEEIPDKLRTSQTYELVATASSGLPVSFESDDLKKAVISGNVMLVNKEGRNNIIAKQAGNVNWNPAPDVTNSYIGQPSFDNVTSLFTPNEDGVNDYWYIPDIEEFGTIQVKVYNRFGKLVYESLDYKNDWNGTFNGSPLPSASYYYIIKSSEKGIINGVVNIVR